MNCTSEAPINFKQKLAFTIFIRALLRYLNNKTKSNRKVLEQSNSDLSFLEPQSPLDDLTTFCKELTKGDHLAWEKLETWCKYLDEKIGVKDILPSLNKVRIILGSD